MRLLMALVVMSLSVMPFSSGAANPDTDGAGKTVDVAALKYDGTLSEFPYPYAVKHFAVDSQGQSLDMGYMYLPSAANKPVVVLMHDKNFNGAYWQSTAEHLHAQGYGVLIPDQIGFGKSSKPVDYQYSFSAFANGITGYRKRHHTWSFYGRHVGQPFRITLPRKHLEVAVNQSNRVRELLTV